MLNEQVQESLAGQVSAELYSAYLYFAVSNYFESEDLTGLASWAGRQSQVEAGHAAAICHYVNSRGGCIPLQSVPAPPSSCATPMVALDEVLHHEQRVTGMLNDLINMATAQRDHATVSFLMQMVSVQVREETRIERLCRRLRTAGQAEGALAAIDHDLSHQHHRRHEGLAHEHKLECRPPAQDRTAD